MRRKEACVLVRLVLHIASTPRGSTPCGRVLPSCRSLLRVRLLIRSSRRGRRQSFNTLRLASRHPFLDRLHPPSTFV